MGKKVKNKRHAGWWFLAIVLLLYLTVALTEPQVAEKARDNFFQALQHLLPMLGVIFILLLAFDRLGSKGWLKRRLTEGNGPGRWLTAVAGGILAAGPVYIWYGLAAELRDRGVSSGLVIAFLYSRAIKLPLLPLLIHYFGLAYTLVLSVYLILFALTGGLLGERLARLRR